MAWTHEEIGAVLDEVVQAVCRDVRNWGEANVRLHNDPYEYARGAEFVLNAFEVRLAGSREFQDAKFWESRRQAIYGALAENPMLQKLHEDQFFELLNGVLQRREPEIDEDEDEMLWEEEDDDEFEWE